MSTASTSALLVDLAVHALFRAIVAHAQHDASECEAAKAEITSIAAAIGPAFGPMLVEAAARSLQARLPRASLVEARKAIRVDVRRLFPELCPDLADVEPRGRA